MMTSVLAIFGASLMASAMAWALSRAGMMPSVRERVTVAARASVVGGGGVGGAAGVVEHGVLGAYGGVVEAGGDGVGGGDLAGVIL